MGRVVLVTGAARELGGRLVRRLQREPGVERVVAVDAVEPGHSLDGAVFVRADIRRPAIVRVLAEHRVDTVVHMDVTGTPLAGGSRASVKESNVIGTMQLLGACQKSPALRRLVVRSSTSVYGSAPRDPAVFTETMPPKSLPSGGFAKDAVEVEGYVRGFARRRPDVAVSVLRFANILGPTADTPLGEYFSLPVLPTVFGYDPRLQFVHEDDVIGILLLVADDERSGSRSNGTFNVAGDGVLLLSQCARRLGRPTVPVLLPAVTWMGSALRTTGLTDFAPEQIRLLTHGRVVSTDQMRETLGYTPAYTSPETFEAFARGRGAGLLTPERAGALVDRLSSVAGRVAAFATETLADVVEREGDAAGGGDAGGSGGAAGGGDASGSGGGAAGGRRGVGDSTGGDAGKERD